MYITPKDEIFAYFSFLGVASYYRQDCLIAGVVDTAVKFIGGVVDTGNQFFGGVVDTGDKF